MPRKPLMFGNTERCSCNRFKKKNTPCEACMTSDGYDWVEIENVKLVRSTKGAGLFQFDDGERVWLPWSLIDEGSVDKDGETGVLVLLKWKAREIGFEV